MRTARLALAAALLLAPLGPRPAAAYLEQTAIGARGIAMGAAAAASTADASALYWNPAGLARLGGPQLIGDHSRPYGVENLGEGSVAWAGRFRGAGVAAGWHRLSVADVYAEDVLSLAAARRLLTLAGGHELDGGLTYKFERLSFQSFRDPLGMEVDFGSQAKGDLDAGLLWRTPWRVDIAWVGRDLLRARFEFIPGSGGGREAARHELAAAWRWNRESTVNVGWSQVDGTDRRSFRAGLEIWFFDVFALRSGFTELAEIASATGSPIDFQFTGGFGVRHRGYQVDAAAYTHHDLGASYRASVVIPLRRDGAGR